MEPADTAGAALSCGYLREWSATLRAHIANLRRKIEPTQGARLIRTEPRVGYRLADGSSERVMPQWPSKGVIEPSAARRRLRVV